ncbi:MAG: transcriptional regulator [Nitrososphaerota archaeon]|nr:transcriptional regulator [Nitrososphaerota archaeon]MDG6939580.1 transcriptional regulator [Nitrososphaerota archaeon]
MPKDQSLGAAILIGSVVGIVIYAWLVFLVNPFVSLIVLEVTAFLAVGAVLAILAWIGYTLATTPPPQPIEEIEKEIEKEAEAAKPKKEPQTDA